MADLNQELRWTRACVSDVRDKAKSIQINDASRAALNQIANALDHLEKALSELAYSHAYQDNRPQVTYDRG